MGRGLNRFRSELNAYRNLQYFGLCERGVVPRYYGYVNRLDPANFRPHLNHFADDMYSPSAIFLEDLQDAEELNSVNYSDSRIQTAICGLDEIHRALIQRRDIYTKNILIIPGPPERIVWIDFDVAVTFPNKEAMSWQVDVSCKCEVEFAKSIGDHLVS
jgi:serine/threonine protein kinase